MKKIFTLLFCSVIITSALAQRRDYDRKDNNHYSVYQNNRYRVDERNRAIQKISYQYDFRIQQVMNDRRMNRRQRKAMVKRLEAEKAQQISRVYARFNNNTVYNRSDNGGSDYKYRKGRSDRDWNSR